MLTVTPRPAGLQYQDPKFLLGRRMFRSGDLIAVVDFEGEQSKFSQSDEHWSGRNWRDRRKSMLGSSVLRYIGLEPEILSLIERETPPMVSWDYDRPCQAHRTAHIRESRLALIEAADMMELIACIGPVRLEEVARQKLEAEGKADFGSSWTDGVHFAYGPATTVDLCSEGPEPTAAFKVGMAQAWRFGLLTNSAVGLLLPCRPDFAPCGTSYYRLNLLFRNFDFRGKERDIEIADHLFKWAEAWAD